MRIWHISVLGICAFFVVALALGLSTGTVEGAQTPSYISMVFDTSSSNVPVLPHASLLLMLAGSLFLALLPAVYELHNGFQFKFKKAKEIPSYSFSLTRSKGFEIGISEKDLAEIGKITKGVVRELKQIAEEKRYKR